MAAIDPDDNVAGLHTCLSQKFYCIFANNAHTTVSSVRFDFNDRVPHTAHPPSSNSLGDVALMKSLMIISDNCMVDGSGGNLFSTTCSVFILDILCL